MIETNSLWCEKYRPNSLHSYIGNEHLITKLEQYINDQDIPHILLSGIPGTGKTTAAKILVNSIKCDHIFINASDENSVDVIRTKIKGFASTMSFMPLKVIVLDEADYITPNGQAALRNLMESFSANVRFILTCNYIEKITPPIMSRVQHFNLIPPSKKHVALLLKNIFDSESIEFDVSSLATIINAHYPDIRKCINTAQNQSTNGKLALDINELVQSDYKLSVLEILISDNKSYTKKIDEIRQIVANVNLKDFTELYRMLFDRVSDYVDTQKIPQSIKAIADGQYRDYFVPDKEINFVATLYNILE